MIDLRDAITRSIYKMGNVCAAMAAAVAFCIFVGFEAVADWIDRTWERWERMNDEKKG